MSDRWRSVDPPLARITLLADDGDPAEAAQLWDLNLSMRYRATYESAPDVPVEIGGILGRLTPPHRFVGIHVVIENSDHLIEIVEHSRPDADRILAPLGLEFWMLDVPCLSWESWVMPALRMHDESKASPSETTWMWRGDENPHWISEVIGESRAYWWSRAPSPSLLEAANA